MASRQAVLGMEQASFFYGSGRVFENVSFLLDDARTALVGENGAGKSTLLKCLTGVLELNAGQVIRSRGLRIGQVPQDVPEGLADQPVREVLARSLARVGQDGEDWRIDVLVDEIGVDPEMLDKPFGALSGGWQRLMLIAAAARLEEPDILILDEPTNHLDLANINTLERWLTVDFTVPMLIVSHDREFLDRVTERTLFLRTDGVHAFKTRFSVAREELLRRDATAAARARQEDREIKRLERAAARYKVWAVKNPDLNKRKNAVESRIARIEKERTQTYVARERRLELADGDIDAKVALRLSNLDVTVPGQRPQADRHRPPRHRRRRARGIARHQRHRQVDASRSACRRLRARPRALRRAGRRALQSGVPAGLFRPDDERAADDDEDPRLCGRGRRRHREGRHTPARRCRLRLRASQGADRRAEPR